MPLTSFCGLLTLQVGAAVLSAVFFTLGAVIVAANVFDYHSELRDFPVSLLLMLIFVIGLIIAGLLMFASSYRDNRRFALLSVLVILILFFYWIILCCFSFVSNPTHINALCIYVRCPESFWLANLYYRRQHEDRYYYNKNITTTTPPTLFPYLELQVMWWPLTEPSDKVGAKKRSIEGDVFGVFNTTDRNWDAGILQINEKITLSAKKDLLTEESKKSSILEMEKEKLKVQRRSTKKVLNANYLPMYSDYNVQRKYNENPGVHFLQVKKDDNDDDDNNNKKDNDSRFVVGFAMAGAILLFLINFIFLLFAALAMWSYASELDYADYYVEDETDDEDDDVPIIVYKEQ